MEGLEGYAPPRGLYVHVPICVSRCAYCDFYSLSASSYSETGLNGLIDASLGRLDEALEFFPPAEGNRYETIYIGGGTPTALPRPLLARLLEGVAKRTQRPLEWTVEANPESLDEEALAIAREAGVSRLSIGVQSLDDDLLRSIGRLADSATCVDAIHRAVHTGDLRVSADLIAGLPRRLTLREEALELVDLGVEHISIYDLSLERGTRLESMVKSGAFRLPGVDEAADERAAADEALEARGFRRYEVSNYAIPGAECLHNSLYWHMDSYIGVGPGAVSTLQAAASEEKAGYRGKSLRIEEARDAMAYGARWASGTIMTDISARDSAFETIMMAYRTIFGLDRASFRLRFGMEPELLIGKTLKRWEKYLVPAVPWPSWEGPSAPARGDDERLGDQALNAQGLDILNRFLVDCLEELEEACIPTSSVGI